ncbi:azurin [Zhouia amylolytica]|uniref:Azurin n=2 Tax=Zhouia amylolytica TaxID=376730 RepID=W2UMI1_9FLAO|nr:azurin [Zhouia amylolytica]ETN94552.1 azurin [Zhouia amylolytica AD3]MCQ0111555.1 azurin [Zhouia amylolytica]SFS78308.1 azurin [Zhouia amylolytica]
MKLFNRALVVAFTGLLISCGGKEEKKKDGFQYEEGSKKTESTTQTKKEDGVSEVVITGDDMMKFNLKEIKVKAGDKVKLTLKHIGKLDKNVMGHNFVLLAQGVDLVDFATKAATAKDTEYIPEGSENDVLAHTKILGGGETDIIEFEAPEKGTYQFLCSFPGHYAMMQGKFIVE